MRMKPWLLFAAFAASLALSAKVTAVRAYEQNGRPLLIPAVQKYESSAGAFKFPAKLKVSVPAGEGIILEQLGSGLARFGVAVEAAEKDADIRFVETKDGVPGSDEGYTLEVAATGVTVRARTAQGLFYGAQTLRNLVRNAAEPELKCCRITDFPDLKVRAYILGINVIPPEKLPHVFATVDALGALKINTLFLMLAESFPYRNNPLTLRRYGYTRQQIEELAEFCRRRHIEIVPVVKLLSHTAWMTWHPHWERMMEAKADKRWNSLNCLLNEENRELVRTTLEEHIGIFKPKTFYIGFDETSRCPFRRCPRCRKVEPVKLLADYLKFVQDIFDRHGIRMSVCHDCAVNSPQWPYGDGVRRHLRRDTLICWWDYACEPDVKQMLPLKEFPVAGFSLSGKPENTLALTHLVRKHGGVGCGMAFWYFCVYGILGDLATNSPHSYAGTLIGADYMWKLSRTPHWKLGYDGTFEMMRLIRPERLTLPPRLGNAVPLPVGRWVNSELSGSGKFPRFADDAALAELRAALKNLPERFELLTAPGGRYYALRVAGTKNGGRQGIRIPFHRRKAEIISLLVTTSRPRNGSDYLYGGYGSKCFKYAPAAHLTLEYADKTSAVVPLRYRWDLTDWNRPVGGFNMRFAARGLDADNNHYAFGIYDLKNPHPEKPVLGLRFSSAKLDNISPALLAVSVWGADRPFPPDDFRAAEVPKRAGVKPDPPAGKPRIVHDFERGMDGISIIAADSIKRAVKCGIVDDPVDPKRGKVLKLTIPQGKYRGQAKDYGFLRLSLSMPYRMPAGTKAPVLDHRIAAAPGEFHHGMEYLLDAPLGTQRHGRMYRFESSSEWKRELRGNFRDVDRPMPDITATRCRVISFFFDKLEHPVEIYVDNIGDTAEDVSAVPLWKDGSYSE